jgi:hypothetical protein
MFLSLFLNLMVAARIFVAHLSFTTTSIIGMPLIIDEHAIGNEVRRGENEEKFDFTGVKIHTFDVVHSLFVGFDELSYTALILCPSPIHAI